MQENDIKTLDKGKSMIFTPHHIIEAEHCFLFKSIKSEKLTANEKFLACKNYPKETKMQLQDRN